MQQKLIFFLLSVFALVNAAFTQSSFAASFDCARASTEVEKAICRDDDLSRLDEKLASVYQTAIQNPSIKKSLQAQQQAWLQVVRDRGVNAFYLKEIYRVRIEQLSSKTPLVEAPTGNFSCTVNISNDTEDEIETRNLSLQVQNGKLIKFTWRSTLTPKSADLRTGFHYHTDMSLSDMNLIKVPGYLVLQSKPLAVGPDRLQDNCDVILTKQGSKLHVYTVGCESRPDTSRFDYKFYQMDSVCRLEDTSH